MQLPTVISYCWSEKKKLLHFAKTFKEKLWLLASVALAAA